MSAEAVRAQTRLLRGREVVAASAVILMLGVCAPAHAQERPAASGCRPEAVERAVRGGVVPSLVGCDVARVEGLLRQGRLRLVRQDRPSAAPAGRILRQTPAAGSQVEPGGRVVVDVSTGQRPERPGATQPDTTRPGTTRPDRPRPDPTRPDPTRPDPTRPDTTRPDTTRPDRPRPDRPRPDPTRPDRPSPDRPRPDPTGRPGPPPQPERPTSADLSVSVESQAPAVGRVGQAFRTRIVVRNQGPGRATRIRVDHRSANLRIRSVGGACARLPCMIAALEPDGAASVFVSGEIAAAGAFGQSVSVRATEPDRRPRNNTAGYGGRAVADPAPPIEPPAPSDTPPDTPPPDTPPVGPEPAPDPPAGSETPPAGPNTRPVEPATPPAEPETPPAGPETPAASDVPAAPDPAPGATSPVATDPGNREVGPGAGAGRDDPVRGRFWLWIALAAVGGALATAAASVAYARAAQQARWQKLITVVPTLDADGEADAGPIEMAGPAVSIRAELESGEAEPEGAVPLRTEREDD